MGAHFFNFPLIQNNNCIRFSYGRQPMGNHHRSSAFDQCVNGFFNHLFTFGINTEEVASSKIKMAGSYNKCPDKTQ